MILKFSRYRTFHIISTRKTILYFKQQSAHCSNCQRHGDTVLTIFKAVKKVLGWKSSPPDLSWWMFYFSPNEFQVSCLSVATLHIQGTNSYWNAMLIKFILCHTNFSPEFRTPGNCYNAATKKGSRIYLKLSAKKYLTLNLNACYITVSHHLSMQTGFAI